MTGKEKVKIVGFNGSARKASTHWAVNMALETAAEYDYVETEQINLGDYKLIPCNGCMKCFGWQHPADAETPECYGQDDDAGKLLTKMMNSDGIIFGTPVYTLGITALARILAEKAHMFGPMSFTKFSGTMRYKPCGVITVGGVDTAGQEVCAQDVWMWAMGLGMVNVGSWPTRLDPNPMASVHGGIVSTCDGRVIYGKDALSKAACRTIPPTQGWRNEKSIRNVGRHVAVAAMQAKLGMRAFQEEEYASPEIIPFTRYSVKPRKNSWVKHLMDEGKVEFVPKADDPEYSMPT